MELRQLRYFVKIAELTSFSEAAKALFITQSTLSQQIKQLENELNAKLFERSNHGVTLTELGEEILPYANSTIQSANSCIEHIRDVQNLMIGTLNIGVTYTFSPILTETILAFLKLYPKVKMNIYYKTMEELMGMLEKSEVDFVLSFKPTNTYDSIESHILFDNHLSIIVNSNHELAKLSKVNWDTLQKYELALPGKGLQARNAFDIITENKGYHFNVKIELNEVNMLLNIVRDTDLVTILSEATIHGIDGIVAVPLDSSGNQLEGCVHIRRNHYKKYSAQEFVRLLCESDSIREKAFNWLSKSY